ncbi:MAG TPA: PAS domain S-box protein, partial [Nitrospira sp.]|nr:PAS domain S-box protein [Nitrospira sp.]
MTVPAAPISDHPSNGLPAWLPTREDISLILGASTEAIFMTDQEDRILFLNSVAQQLVGRTRDVIGRGFHDLIGCLTSGESEAAQCPFTRMANTGEPVVISSQVWNREDGTQFELSLSFWRRTHQGVPVGGLVVVRDLTDAMEIQRDVQRAARLAEDA